MLLPAAYYEATILQEQITTPCAIGRQSGKCYHFKYPDIASYPRVKAEVAYKADGDKRELATMYTHSPVIIFLCLYIIWSHDFGITVEILTLFFKVLDELDVGQMAILNQNQSKIFIELSLPKTGRYALVIFFHTPQGGKVTNLMIDAVTAGGREKGRAILYDCSYSSLCRQVVTDLRGKVSFFNFDNNQVTLELQGGENSFYTIESIVAIPARQWHSDFIRPRFACARQDGKCIVSHFQVIPGSIKVTRTSWFLIIVYFMNK